MNEKAAPIKVTGAIGAWCTSDYDMGTLMRALEDGNQQKAVNTIYYSCQDMASEGWVKVGIATIEVEIAPIEELQSQQLATLVAQLEKERADSMVRQNELTDKISKLQALSYSGPFVDPGLVDECPF